MEKTMLYGRQKSVGSELTRVLKKAIGMWQLYVLILPALVYLIIFSYFPMYGIQIAFKNYRVSMGIWGSPWVGFQHFERFLTFPDFWKIMGNTLRISFKSKEIGDSGTSLVAYLFELGGYKDQYTKEGEFDLNTADGRVNQQRYDAVAKYAVDGAPSILYFDAETSARIADLTAVISSYATTQTANFITGKRDISEVNDYLAEIRASGGDELNEIYNNAYQEYLNSMK